MLLLIPVDSCWRIILGNLILWMTVDILVQWVVRNCDWTYPWLVSSKVVLVSWISLHVKHGDDKRLCMLYFPLMLQQMVVIVWWRFLTMGVEENPMPPW